MKRFLHPVGRWLAAMLFALALGCVGTASAQKAADAAKPASTIADARLERQVEHRLSQKPELQKVEASVDNSVATLTGQVPTLPDKDAATKVAANVGGVKDVQNKVELDPDLGVRFGSALNEVQAKLVRLIANLPLLLVAILMVVVASWLGRVVSARLAILKRISGSNPYMDGLLRGIVHGVIALGGVLLALDLLGATSLVGAVLGSAGVVGLVLGFAFKDIAENYIAGVLLSLRRPFNPGDLVRIDTHEGRVVALTSRTTQLMTLEGNQLQLPNSLMFKSVLLNYTRNPNRRFDFTTNVAVGQSWHAAMDIGIQAISGVEGVLETPAPSALIRELSDFGATLQFFGWINQRNNDLPKTRSEAMRSVRRNLRDAGILPPDGVQRLLLVRETESQPTATRGAESAQTRDTSVDHTLDHQLQNAQDDDGVDLLENPKPKPGEP